MKRLLFVASALGAAVADAQAQRAERFTSWTAPTFPVAEYVARHRAVLARLGENEILLVPSAEGTSAGETFRQLDDFEYLTASRCRGRYLRLTAAQGGRSSLRRPMTRVSRTPGARTIFPAARWWAIRRCAR